MLPEAIEVSVLTSVDAFSVVLVTEVGIFVTANVAVLLADPVAVDMLVVWLGVVTLDVDIVNSEAVVLRTDGMRSATVLVALCFVVVAAVAVVVAPFSSVAFRVVVGLAIDVA